MPAATRMAPAKNPRPMNASTSAYRNMPLAAVDWARYDGAIFGLVVKTEAKPVQLKPIAMQRNGRYGVKDHPLRIFQERSNPCASHFNARISKDWLLWRPETNHIASFASIQSKVIDQRAALTTQARLLKASNMPHSIADTERP